MCGRSAVSSNAIDRSRVSVRQVALVGSPAREHLQGFDQLLEFTGPVQSDMAAGQVTGRRLPDVFPVTINSDEPPKRHGGDKMSDVEAIVRHPRSSETSSGDFAPSGVVRARHSTGCKGDRRIQTYVSVAISPLFVAIRISTSLGRIFKRLRLPRGGRRGVCIVGRPGQRAAEIEKFRV